MKLPSGAGKRKAGAFLQKPSIVELTQFFRINKYSDYHLLDSV